MEDLIFLRMLQLFDSALPVGNFAHSGGIETYGQLDIKPAELASLLANQIEMGTGRLDLAASALAWENSEDAGELARLGEEIDAWKVVPSICRSSKGLGKRTLSIAGRLFPDRTGGLDIASPHQAVVVGALARRLGIPERETLLALAQGQMAACLAAAVRCMPLSPGRAQEILAGLQPGIIRTVDIVLEDPEGSFFASTPALDIRAHQQKSLYTRLFQS